MCALVFEFSATQLLFKYLPFTRVEIQMPMSVLKQVAANYWPRILFVIRPYRYTLLIQFITVGMYWPLKSKQNIISKQSLILWKHSFLFPDQNKNVWMNFLDYQNVL